jgi:type VI secretion system protein ImpG
VRPLGLEPEDSQLPRAPGSFSGHALLSEYFALPSRFLAVGLEGLGEALRRAAGNEVELVVLLGRHDESLATSLSSCRLSPHCTPVINLFERSADRIALSHRDHEYHVVVDRTKPRDHEVHGVVSVTGVGKCSRQRREFRPLFECRYEDGERAPRHNYTLRREPRRASTGTRLSESNGYAGSETFLSLSDAGSGAYGADLKQLSLRVACTNRDLPLEVPPGGELQLDTGAPVAAIRFVAGPSRPRPPLFESAGRWPLVNHLSLNYLSLTNSGGGRGAEALRELLGLYATRAEASLKRQVEGVLSVESRAVFRRLPLPGPVSFGRGLRVELGFDEAAFEGLGSFVLGSVLDRFFAGYASINCFVQTALSTRQRERVVDWPLRLGARPAL